MGDDEITAAIRQKLERELDSLQATLKKVNEEPVEREKRVDKILETVLNVVAKVVGTAIGISIFN